ncbi:30S ribosomal protein S7 [Candidatus Vidania fulgoroideorum]
MSRRKRSYVKRKRIDLKYMNVNVERLINMIMKSGKKSISRKIVYKALSMIRTKYLTNPIDILEKAIINIAPELEIKSKKIGGTFYKVPVRINSNRSFFIALKWIKDFAKSRKEKSFSISLFKEIIDTYNGNSNGTKKRDEIYKIADLNRAFSNFSF